MSNKVTKLEKLRNSLEDNKKKLKVCNENIKKIEGQILEEENKEFKSILETVNLTFEEAIKLLKENKTNTSENDKTLDGNTISRSEEGR